VVDPHTAVRLGAEEGRGQDDDGDCPGRQPGPTGIPPLLALVAPANQAHEMPANQLPRCSPQRLWLDLANMVMYSS